MFIYYKYVWIHLFPHVHNGHEIIFLREYGKAQYLLSWKNKKATHNIAPLCFYIIESLFFHKIIILLCSPIDWLKDQEWCNLIGNLSFSVIKKYLKDQTFFYCKLLVVL
jgi:hypothetical protein